MLFLGILGFSLAIGFNMVVCMCFAGDGVLLLTHNWLLISLVLLVLFSDIVPLWTTWFGSLFFL